MQNRVAMNLSSVRMNNALRLSLPVWWSVNVGLFMRHGGRHLWWEFYPPTTEACSACLTGTL